MFSGRVVERVPWTLHSDEAVGVSQEFTSTLEEVLHLLANRAS